MARRQKNIRGIHRDSPQHEPKEALEVFIKGMGTSTSEGDAPIFIENYEGKWILHVWADINQEDPTHSIDLSRAMERNRR